MTTTGKLALFARQWLLPLALALVVAMLLRSYVFAIIRVDGSSMEPTLSDGERAVVTKIDLHFTPIGRGEVVICHYPDDTRYYVKRVVALGGDTVEIRGGTLYVNGQAVEEPYIAFPAVHDLARVEVPQGAYYALGDNRPHSKDSRSVGPLDSGLIVGRVRAVVWPISVLRGIAAP